MIKICCSNWGEFVIEDWFEVELASGDIQAKNAKNGPIPLVSSIKANNGIIKYIEERDDSKKFTAGSITVDMFGKVFYQPNDFYSVSHGRVNILNSKFEISENALLFFVATLDKSLGDKYGYNNMCSSAKIKKHKIKLPQTEETTPDWGMMDKHLVIIKEEAEQRVYKLWLTQNIELTSLPSRSWGRFSIGDLFDTITQGERVRKMDQVPGDLPFVMAGYENQGISKHISNEVFVYPPNAITMDVFGNVFYRDYKFGASDDVGVYYNKKDEYTRNQMIFITVSYKKRLGIKAFNNKIRASKTHDIMLFLPQTEEGEPDWGYMNEYIEELKDDVNNKVDSFLTMIV